MQVGGRTNYSVTHRPFINLDCAARSPLREIGNRIPAIVTHFARSVRRPSLTHLMCRVPAGAFYASDPRRKLLSKDCTMPYARDFEDSSTLARFSINEQETRRGIHRDHRHFAMYRHLHRWPRHRPPCLYEVGDSKRA